MSRLPPESEPRERIVTPRTRGYVYRPFITMLDGVAVTEDGEPIGNLPVFAASMPSHIWMVDAPATVLAVMVDAFGHVPDFNYQIITSEEDTDGPRFVHSRITRFGFRCKCEDKTGCPWRKRNGMHLVWTPRDLSPTPGKLMPVHSHQTYRELVTDVRGWCDEQNLPIPTTLAGLANSLMRDARFWPEARGRVPRATNENVRKFLPGVYAELRTAPGETHNVIAIDQTSAYHVVATQVPVPDPSTLFARGYFNAPDTSPIWTTPGDRLYERTVRQPGIVYAQLQVLPKRKHQTRPPAVADSGRYRAALWTNELAHCQANGVIVEGLTAAWTANLPDPGIATYGHWAQHQLGAASSTRKRWLKPTLHAVYGLFGVRPRKLSIGHYRGNGKNPATARVGFGHEFTVNNAELGSMQSNTANVATLGVLQSEIRVRSLALARDLSERGLTVLHIHADGVHVAGDTPPLIPADWRIEGLTRLMYLDKNSWVADEREALPGRDERARVHLRRRQARAPFHGHNHQT